MAVFDIEVSIPPIRTRLPAGISSAGITYLDASSDLEQ